MIVLGVGQRPYSLAKPMMQTNVSELTWDFNRLPIEVKQNATFDFILNVGCSGTDDPCGDVDFRVFIPDSRVKSVVALYTPSEFEANFLPAGMYDPDYTDEAGRTPFVANYATTNTSDDFLAQAVQITTADITSACEGTAGDDPNCFDAGSRATFTIRVEVEADAYDSADPVLPIYIIGKTEDGTITSITPNQPVDVAEPTL